MTFEVSEATKLLVIHSRFLVFDKMVLTQVIMITPQNFEIIKIIGHDSAHDFCVEKFSLRPPESKPKNPIFGK